MDSYDGYGSPGRNRESDSFTGRASGESYRRRSPASQDRRRARPRSRSPVIDRYEPSERRSHREDFYNNSREHAAREREDRRRAPSPTVANIDRYVPGQDGSGGGGGKRPIPTNPMPNPLTLDFQVGFNWFAEWWRLEESVNEEKERAKNGGRRVKGEREAREDREKERAQIQAAYDTYKVDLQIRLARLFVQQHRNEEWFKERYVPEVRDPLRTRLMAVRQGAYEQWEHDMDNNLFKDFTLEGIYKSDSDGAGGVVEKEEGETTATAETMGVLDLLPVRGGDLRDEALAQPALLIKTLAPNVSRSKIEEFCKEHLGEEDGGFKGLSLSDPNPSKKFHRMGWIMLHPSANTNTVERGDGRDEEFENMDHDGSANGGVTTSPAEKALEAVNDKTIHDSVHGDFVCHVGVHVPPAQPRKKALWDLFSAPERIDRDLELAKRLTSKLDSEMNIAVDGFTKIDEYVDDLRGKGELQPPATGPVSAKKQRNGYSDEEDEEEIEEGEEKEIPEEEDVDDEELAVKKKKLDLVVEYLRRVYNFCFFCVFESDSVHELGRKCPGGHLRRPRTGLSTQAKEVARASALGQPFPAKKKEPSEEGEDLSSPVQEKRGQRHGSKSEQQLQRAFNWVKTFEDKLLQILEPENVDLSKLGGKPVDQALEDELLKYMKQEDDSKYRCKAPECTKLFKAEAFWRKHIEKRHVEWFEGIKNDLALVNAYVLDPARIAPSRSDANSNGHFPLGSGQGHTGTPRGFSLASLPYTPNGNMSTFPPSGMPGMMGAHAGGWNANAMGHDGGLHQPGPMRRGQNRNNRPGPYDRRRFNGNGRLSPPRGMPGMYGGGRLPPPGVSIPAGHPAASMAAANPFPDSSSGGPMAPREAVQGRSLKSYEDLDAVDASGSGELQY